jgi:tetratricopeptide (TPR) repeat protein
MVARLAWIAALLTLGCASSLERATQKTAKTSDRPLVIMATAKWCGPCKTFKKHVLPSPRVQAALRDVEFVMLDEADSKGSIRRLGVRGYPTFLVVTPDQKVVARMAGGTRVERFIDFLTWGTPRWFTRKQLEDGLAGGPTTRLRLYAARFFALEGDIRRTRALYREALASIGPDEEWRRSTIAWEMTLVGSIGGTLKAAAEQAASFAARYPDSAELAKAVRFALLSGALPPQQALALGQQALRTYSDDAQALNGLTYDLLTAKMPLLAVEAAKRAVELQPEEANAHDTLAEAYHYAGNRELALRHAEEAVGRESAEDNRRVFERNRQRFTVGGVSPSVVANRRQFQRLVRRYKLR